MVECEVFFFQLVHVLENDELSLYVNSPAEVRDDMFISILYIIYFDRKVHVM